MTPPRAPVVATPGVWPVLWLGSLAAVYACVPETDRLHVVGAVFGGFALVELADRRPFPWTAQAVIAGVVVWAAWHGAAGRTRAEIGGLFAALFPATLMVLARALPSPMRPSEPARWAIGVIGIGCALGVARTGALEPGAEPVLRSIAVWGSAALAGSGCVVLAAARSRRSRPRPEAVISDTRRSRGDR